MLTFLAVYYSAASISGAFGGVLAYGIQTDLTYTATGRRSWEWLFIIEGTVAVVAGIAIVFLLPRYPDDLQKRDKKHWLLTTEEIDCAAQRCACKFRFPRFSPSA
jgi:MFS family permease